MEVPDVAMSNLRNDNVVRSKLRNFNVALSNLRNDCVPYHYN